MEKNITGRKQRMEFDEILLPWEEWKLTEIIGSGTYGTVYKAIKDEQGIIQESAIKIISIPEASEIPEELLEEKGSEAACKAYIKEQIDAFGKEIIRLNSIKDHEHIVRVEDYMILEKEEEFGWNIFIRMKLLTPLSGYLSYKSITEKEVIKLGEDLCSALEVCKEQDILHGDIKPSNILVDENGAFKIGDFGIVRFFQSIIESETEDSGYMAPEVVESQEYNQSTDLYAAGMILYYYMNRKRGPFLDLDKQIISYRERNEAQRKRIRGEKLNPPVDASEELAEIILKACSAEREQRFSSACEMKHALQNILEEKPAKSRSVWNLEEDEDDVTFRVKPSQRKMIQEPYEKGYKEPPMINFRNISDAPKGRGKRADKRKEEKLLLVLVVVLIGIIGVLGIILGVNLFLYMNL